MIKTEDCHPFPIQGETVNGMIYPACTVPEWLAKLAHDEYARQHTQSFKRIAERGGFGRAELVALIRGNYTRGIRKAQEDLASETDPLAKVLVENWMDENDRAKASETKEDGDA